MGTLATGVSRAGVWHLLYPVRRAVMNRVRHPERRDVVRLLQTVVVGGLLWGIMAMVAIRLLGAFRQYPEIATPLTLKALSLMLSAGLFLTLVATTVAALGTFFMAKDAPLILAAPVDWLDRYLAQLLTSSAQGSWVLGLVFVPLLAAVRLTHGGGWAFLVVALLGAPCLVLFVSAIGSVFAIGLAALGGAARSRTVLLIGGLGATGMLMVAVRNSASGQLMGAASSASPMALMEMLNSPSAPWLPSEWWARALVNSGAGVDWVALGGMLGAALGAVTLAAMFYRATFTAARVRAARRDMTTNAETRASAPVWAWAERRWGPSAVQLARKDLRRLMRETSEWSHALLAFFGLAIYLINMHAMPLSGTDPATRLFADIISLVNLGVGGLILASLSTFYVFPSISYDAPGLSLLRSAPVTPATIVRAKFVVGMITLTPIALGVSGAANLVLHTSAAMTVLMLTMSLALAVGIVSLGVWLGAALPRFDARSPGDIASSVGALYFLGAAISLCLFVIMCVAPYALTVLAEPGATLPPALRSWGHLTPAVKSAGIVLGVVAPLLVGWGGLRAAGRALERAFANPSGHVRERS